MITLILLLVAIYLACRGDWHACRNRNLETLNDSLFTQLQDAHSHIETHVAYAAYLEACQRHQQAAAAGLMILAGAINPHETLRVGEGVEIP